MQHDKKDLGALREVPYMGVIYVVAEAMKLGYRNGHPEWANLGQGQPEVGDMEGAPPRISSVEWLPEDQAYGPLEGTPELRESVASHVNRLHRRGRKPYRAGNVAIAQGGRLALTRAMAALGSVNIGTLLPDYTAYEDMLTLHLPRLGVTGVRTHEDTGFALKADAFEGAVIERGLSAFVLSNPCNPTGAVIAGEELARMIATARVRRVTLLLDEFYSHFIYGQDAPVSGAEHVEDPDRDPVLVFDGLTKNFRYPGWRVGWVLGPPPMVEAIARTASAIDGGPSRISQRAALLALEPERADAETKAVRAVFRKKRDVMVSRLAEMGVRLAAPPAGTFYCWGSLAGLPPSISDGMSFFRAALERKVLTVPGEFFDVNPGKYRRGESPYRQWMRFSFGPSMDVMQAGLDRLSDLVREAR